MSVKIRTPEQIEKIGYAFALVKEVVQEAEIA